MEHEAYPLTLKGELRETPSRALWLVKWLLLIPHIICLAGLWVAFIVLTIIAFFAILFTGEYPQKMFDFNVGVLRWTWRVSFYGYGALATDEYPPFSLDPDEEYPADLFMEYPEKLSNGMVLVKWLLAAPHYAVLLFLTGLGLHYVYEDLDFEVGGLLSVLILITAIVLLFAKRYLQDIFKLVVGINRWAFRVAAYVFLLTDKYPPFRFEE
jgi:hypothetical protein